LALKKIVAANLKWVTLQDRKYFVWSWRKIMTQTMLRIKKLPLRNTYFLKKVWTLKFFVVEQDDTSHMG